MLYLRGGWIGTRLTPFPAANPCHHLPCPTTAGWVKACFTCTLPLSARLHGPPWVPGVPALEASAVSQRPWGPFSQWVVIWAWTEDEDLNSAEEISLDVKMQWIESLKEWVVNLLQAGIAIIVIFVQLRYHILGVSLHLHFGAAFSEVLLFIFRK